MGTPAQVLEQAAVSGYDQAHARKQQRKDMLTDEQHAIKRDEYLDNRKSYKDQLNYLKDENGNIRPESQGQADKINDLATKNEFNLGQLYDPITAPGRLQQDWHYLLDKIHGIKQPPAVSTTSQTPEMTLNTPPAPITTPELPGYQQTTPALALDDNLHTHPGSVTTDVAGVAATTLPGMTAPSAPPLTITQSFEGKPAPGMVTQGNLDLSKRPNIDNGDGTHSSTFSMSFGTDKGEVLVPGVGDGKTYPARQLRVLYTLPDGSQKWAVPGNQPHNWIAPQHPTPQNNEALNQYHKTGKNFGTFEDDKAADAYGKTLHEDQEKYGNDGLKVNPASRPAGNITLPAGPTTKVTQAPTPSWGQAQVLKQKAAAMQKAQQDVNLLLAGAPLSPQQQAMSKLRTDALVKDAQIDEALKRAEKLGITGPALEEFKQQLVGIKNVSPKSITGAAGAPYQGSDGLWYKPVMNPDMTTGKIAMPPDWKPNTKAVAGSIVNSTEHGWIKPWYDPYTRKMVGFQKVTPGRQYAGSTSSSTAIDSAGVKTSTSRSTMPTNTAPVDMDFSGIQELPKEFNGEEIPASSPSPTGQTPADASSPSGAPTSAPPPSVSKPITGGTAPKVQPKSALTPGQVRSNIPAPPPSTPANGKTLDTDPSGHLPADALGVDGKPVNSQIREGANQLLDGVDMKDLTMSSKDKPTAEAVARLYGWGRGPFLPRELKQMQNATQFLDQALNSDAFMRAIDQGIWRRTATAVAQKDSAKEGILGTIGHMIAQGTLNSDQKEYLNIRQALMGTVSGLSSMVRSGRPTEATINRLAQEIPDVMSSADSKQAKQKIAQIKKELAVALAQGVPAPTPKNAASSSTGSRSATPQHKEGDWVMYKGQKVQIKKINPDGTAEY